MENDRKHDDLKYVWGPWGIPSSAGVLQLLGIRNRPAPHQNNAHLLSCQPIVFGFRNDVNELLEIALGVVYMVSIYVTNRGAGRSILRPYQVNSVGRGNAKNAKQIEYPSQQTMG